MSKGSSPPPASDPVATANAQGAANADAVRESAKVNQINQISPQGSQTWSGEIGSPDRTVTTTLNPTAQDTFNQQQELARQLTGLAAGRADQIPTGQFSLSGVPQLQGASPEDRKRIEDSTYAQNTRFLDPQYEQSNRKLQDQLYNQGFKPGDEGWDTQMANFERSKSADYGNARNAAVNAGAAEDSRQFGMSQTARNQGISDTLLERTQPMNELAAFLQGSPAINNPNFAAPAQYQVAPADVLGAQQMSYNGAQNQYNQGQQNQRSMYGGLASLGAAAIPVAFSDPRVKEAVRRVGTWVNGLGLYLFRYIWGGPEHLGFMADEVEKIHPEAVSRINGFMAVDYAMAVQ